MRVDMSMIRVQADRDGDLEMQCLEPGCPWEWAAWNVRTAQANTRTLAELIAEAVTHNCTRSHVSTPENRPESRENRTTRMEFGR